MPIMRLSNCNKRCEVCGGEFVELRNVQMTSVQLWCENEHLAMFTGDNLKSLTFEAKDERMGESWTTLGEKKK